MSAENFNGVLLSVQILVVIMIGLKINGENQSR
jgi:hypothetical protein